MLVLIAGLSLFLGAHSIRIIPGARPRLQAAMGEMVYKLAYSVVSLAGFGLIIYGMMIAQPAPSSGRHRPGRGIWPSFWCRSG